MTEALEHVSGPSDLEDPRAALRERYGPPLDLGLMAHIDYLHMHYADFIRRSPFCLLATSDLQGRPSVSPKGDQPGFVEVVDAHTILFPDRPGNNQIISMQNIAVNPKVQLIFLVPGRLETLRVDGLASISTDPDLLKRMSFRDKPPKSVVTIKVYEAFMHCGKSVIRAQLWDPSTQVAKGEMASIARVTKDICVDAPYSYEQMEELTPVIYQATLY
ncbi:MSMEG_1061 family FMN-dependent PPOX-type flavoprotein [Bradyrhizobium sp. CCBAU 53338]|uniref:MSMEG_1061 family FMN-dependent PPOX-type flavoprotein n=1 Tax=Bradyrhizobium sp. CCBAU 53338 TaxID=1325111 RepID=UPI00188AEDA3|nr:MSMEG_1061 family FMN-dependent PPOX-type flavoprotein [Bradyrhizobium sp. CCBAU 53338]